MPGGVLTLSGRAGAGLNDLRHFAWILGIDRSAGNAAECKLYFSWADAGPRCKRGKV